MLRPTRKPSLPGPGLAAGNGINAVFDPAQLVNAPPSPSPYAGPNPAAAINSYFAAPASSSSSSVSASAANPGSASTGSALANMPPTPGLPGTGAGYLYSPLSNHLATGPLSPALTNGGAGTGSSTPLSGLGPGGVPLAHGAPQAASTIGNRPAIAASSLYQACLNLRDRLWCVDGFGHAYLDGPLVAAAIAAVNPPSADASSSSDLASPLTPTATGSSTPTGLGPGSSLSSSGAASASSATGNNVSLDASEPVSKLWATFRLGTPLCALYNALFVQPIDANAPSTSAAKPILGPGGQPLLVVNNDLAYLRHNPRECKKLVAHFIMGIRKQLEWGPDEVFSVSDLYLDDTNGFVRVVRTVSKLLDVFASRGLLVPSQDPAGGNAGSEGASAAKGGLAWSVNELLNTERKYVQDLEAMQNYARALQKNNILAPDTIHRLFGNLNALVDVSRRFLICVEENARRPPEDQHFGHAVMAMENDFAVYEPFCANYSQALDTINAETPNMLRLKDCPGSEDYYLTPNYELPSLLIKPVQRICKYPLLLEQIIKNTPDDAAHKQELLDGLHVVKRIAEKVNETQRMQENEQVVKELEARVDDWKGHNVYTFGNLLLHEHFTVIKSETEREYYVYLFEKILLCCKDPPGPNQSGKDKKKKDKKAPPAPVPGIGKKEKGPLQLKGRIFTENMTGAYPQTKIGSVLGVPGGQYSLQLWWRNEHDVETLGLKCKNEEQLSKWKTALNRLIDEAAARRKSQSSAGSMMGMSMSNMTGAGANGRRLTNGSSSFPITPLTETAPFPFRSGGSSREDMDPAYASAAAASRGGPHSNINGQHHGGSGGSGAYGASRFSQPAEHRERKMSLSQETLSSRPRARTEDQDGATMQQWRSHSPNPAGGGGRPPLPRNSGSSVAQHTMQDGVALPPTLRKASSSRQLRPVVAPLQMAGLGGPGGMNGPGTGPMRMMPQRMNTNDGMEFMDVPTPPPGSDSFGPGGYGGGLRRLEDGPGLSRSGSEGLAAYRNRSASNPQQYVPHMPGNAPPLPRQFSQIAAAYGAGPTQQHHLANSVGPSGNGSFTPVSSHSPVPAHAQAHPAAGGGPNAQGWNDQRRFSTSSFSTVDSTHSGSRHDSMPASSASTFGLVPGVPGSAGFVGGGMPQGSYGGNGGGAPSMMRNAMALGGGSGSNVGSSQGTSAVSPPTPQPVSQAVKLIISHGDEKFTIVVLQSIGFADLQDKVTKKLRLCSGRKNWPEGGVRIRYVDEDGDVVAMNEDEDVQMAFEAGRKTRQDVTLIVS